MFIFLPKLEVFVPFNPLNEAKTRTFLNHTLVVNISIFSIDFFQMYIILCIFLATKFGYQIRGFQHRPISVCSVNKKKRWFVGLLLIKAFTVAFHFYRIKVMFLPQKNEKLSKTGPYTSNLWQQRQAQSPANHFFDACAPCSNNDTKPFDNLFFRWTNLLFQKQQRANGGNRNIDVSKPKTAYTVCKIRQYFRPWSAWKVIFETLVF